MPRSRHFCGQGKKRNETHSFNNNNLPFTFFLQKEYFERTAIPAMQ
jgi:hypothetical protein